MQTIDILEGISNTEDGVFAADEDQRIVHWNEAVLHMAAKDNSEVREWCCPVYDHLLVFKKLNKIT